MRFSGKFSRALVVPAAVMLAAAVPRPGEAREKLRTYFSVEINMEKREFKAGEPVEGKVIVRNSAPATLLGSFVVKLYKNEELRLESTVKIKTIFAGKNSFRLKNFGIPDLQDEQDPSGVWRIIIHQVNRPQDAAEAVFKITDEGAKESGKAP